MVFRIAAVVIAILGFATWLHDLAPRVSLAEPIIVIGATFLAAAVLGARADAVGARLRDALVRPSPRLFALTAGAAVLFLSTCFVWYCFDAQPWVIDELTQRFQSRLLARGRLWLRAESLPEFFETRQTATVDGRMFGEFPVGGPLVMAVGEILRVRWLVNPALAALTAVGLYRFLARAGDEVTARLTTLLFVASPFVLFMSASQMSHVAALAALMLALCGLVEWTTAERAGRARWGAVTVGAGVGLLAAIRPYDAVLVAVPIAVFQLAVLRRESRRWPTLLWQAGAGAIPVAIVLLANQATTGNPLLFGYDVVNGEAHRPGFHVDPEGVPFTPARGLFQLSLYFARLNTVLLEWPVPVVALIAGTLAIRRGATRWEYLLLGLIGSVVTGYWAYWHDGDAFGPRFLFLVVPAFLFFVARLPGAVVERVETPLIRRAAWILIPLCLAIAWVPLRLPGRATGVWTRASDYRSALQPTSPDVGKQLADASLEHALVFVREPWNLRLAARLRASGLTPFFADALLAEMDACVLHEALDREDGADGGSPTDRLDRALETAHNAGVAVPDPTRPGSAKHLVFVPGRPLTEACKQELERDVGTGATPLAVFLPFNDFDSDGRLGGRVVFVRDLGHRNEALRDRFGDRTWYRYIRTGAGPAFERYSEGK